MGTTAAALGPDEHCFVAGMTGSGKTFLLKNYLAGNEKQTFVLDTKGTFEWEQIPKKDLIMVNHLTDLSAAAGSYKNIVYRPAREELEFSYYDAFFQFCYELKNNTVAVDEVMQICPNPSRIPEYYKGILTRGRELNVNIWSATQRPATIPVVIYSEATHWFIFKLNSAHDRERLSAFIGYEELTEIIPKQIFWYYNANTGEPPVKGKLIVKGG